jgi:hypothetical protein
MAKHTPGPWSVGEGTPDIAIITDKVLVAMVTNDEDSPCEDDEQMANARLMAAAPELLEACEAALLLAGDDDLPDNGGYNGAAITDQIRAAIAKAEGGGQ